MNIDRLTAKNPEMSDGKSNLEGFFASQDKLETIEKLSPAEQIKLISDLSNEGYADVWFSVFYVQEFLSKIKDDHELSPLVRFISVSALKRLDANGAHKIDELNNIGDKEDFGYSSIVDPGSVPEYMLSEKDKNLSEEEIKTELVSLRKEELNNNDSRTYDENSDWWDDDDLLSRYNRENELQLALDVLRFKNNQAKLNQEFSNLPKDKQLVKIASDAAATVEFSQESEDGISIGSIDIISDKDGRLLSSLLDDETILYLKAVHGGIAVCKNVINGALDSDITKIPIESQIHLLNFMAKANNERFENLCKTMGRIRNKDTKGKILENFVAADFGEDFGDSLLDIANSERISDKELGEILKTIDSCRSSIRKISGFYRNFDDKFAEEYARAANERLTDSLAVFRAIASGGKAEADLGWAGKTEFNCEEALEALGYEAKSLEIISGTLSDVASNKEGAFAELILTPDERQQRTMYSFYSPDYGYVLLHTRPEGSGTFNPMIEYGKNGKNNVGIEASISLITNPVDPFSLPNPFRPDPRAVRNPNFYDTDTMDKVSAIRLDREGRKPDEPANTPNRDPINEVGTISVDLAAIGDREDTPSGKIARLFSAGNTLRALKNGSDFALNHNASWFDQGRYGTSDGFKELVKYVDQMAHGWCDSCPPKDDEGFKGAKRAAS